MSGTEVLAVACRREWSVDCVSVLQGEVASGWSRREVIGVVWGR